MKLIVEIYRTRRSIMEERNDGDVVKAEVLSAASTVRIELKEGETFTIAEGYEGRVYQRLHKRNLKPGTYKIVYGVCVDVNHPQKRSIMNNLDAFSSYAVEEKDKSKLKGMVIQVEAEIKEIVGDPLNFYVRNSIDEETSMRLDDLVSTRSQILDEMFTATPEEIARFRKVNDLLFGLTNQMYHRTCDLYRSLLRHGTQPSYDDDYEVEGAIRSSVDYVADDPTGDVVQLDNDDYYGSEFDYMLCVVDNQQEHSRGECVTQIESCSISHSEENTPEMTDEELGCVNTLDDGQSWAEGYLWNPALKDIVVCHAVHVVCTHLDYSIPDLLRINNYWTDIKLDCQHITDQRGRRWAEIRKDRDDTDDTQNDDSHEEEEKK